MQVEKLLAMAKLVILAFVVHMCTAQDDPGVFQFRATEISVSESSQDVTVVIENTGNKAQSATVSLSTADGTAKSGVDYIGFSKQLVSFTSGVATQEVTIPIINDSEVEGKESFVVSLRVDGPRRPSAKEGPRSSVTITIVDDEQQPPKPPVSADGGNITLDYEAKIQVVCRKDYIEVSLQIADYPGIIVNDSSLHLEDKACGAGYKDDTMVKFTIGLEDCKTEQEDDGKKIYYRNKVYFNANVEADDSAITRKHMQIIPFQCGFDKKTTISKISYDPKSTLLITDADGIGNFTYSMDMYVNENNTETVTEFPKEIGLGMRMYFGFRVESANKDLLVFPDVCKATASSSFDSTPVHLIIENACSRDNTLEYQYGQKNQHYFNIAAFRFTEGYEDVFIHCKLTVCPANDDTTRCAKGCEPSKRKRRSTEEDMSVNLYVGPLRPKITTDDAAKEHSEAESESGNSMVLIVAVLVGVLGTVTIGLIAAVIIISRRRNSPGKGASLIIAEDM